MTHDESSVNVDAAMQIDHHLYIILCEIFGVLTFLVITLIAMYHMLIVYKYQKASKLETKFYPSLKLSYILVVVAVIFNTSLCIYAFDVKSLAICYYGKFAGIPLYSIFKLLLYLILVCRVWIIFKQFDQYAYNIKKLKLFCSLLTVWCFINIALIVLFAEIHFLPNQRPVCYINPPQIGLASIGFLDIVAGIGNAYLYIKPAIALHNKQIKSKRESSFVIIAFKQCVLSIIAILSSIIGLICIAIFSMPQIFAGIDVIISTLCIIFMYDWNEYIVEKICCAVFCCLPKESVHLKSSQNDQKLENNIEITNTKNIEITNKTTEDKQT
eukprot:135937_1